MTNIRSRETNMARVFIALGLAVVVAWPAQSDWYFRGTPNDWGTAAMDPIAGTSRLKTCQTFRVNRVHALKSIDTATGRRVIHPRISTSRKVAIRFRSIPKPGRLPFSLWRIA